MTDLQAMARVHWGRWIADCPRPGCTNAEHHGRDEHTGHVGGLADGRFRCAICLLACPAVWPAQRAEIDRLLGQRPAPQTRNWMPGETTKDLLAENAMHGILPTEEALAAVMGVA